MSRWRAPRPWRTLRGRLVLGAAVGLTVAAVVFAAVGGGLIRAQSQVVARAELDRQARALAGLVSTQYERQVADGREFTFYQPAALEALVGARTRLYYTGLALTPGSDRPTADIPSVAAEEIDYGELEREGVQRIDFRLGDGPQLEASAAPVYLGDEIVGAILLARPPGQLASAWPDVAGRVIGAAGIGLGVALLLSLLMTTRITRPLTAMQAATHRVAGGDLRTELGPTGTQELDELAADFNRMVRRLAEREGETRDFLMRVTHDLRTPLTAIRGHTAALVDGVVPEGEAPRSLAAIASEAGRLDALVSDLLDLARLDARHFALDLGRVEPAGVLRRAVEAMRPAAAAGGVELTCELGGMAPVVTDASRVQRIVGNLLENAIHWTPRGGAVRLEGAARPGGGFTAAVCDTGPGVPAGDRERIFEPFQSRETPSGRRGSGLGLAISRQLARALGGDVRVEAHEGAGSRFVLEVPARAPRGPGRP
ncbi:sensor histidine kinase [Miltoncostaea marina]|uniref:sensor histidine kinase n=1 Tax=Miltoncostaea marina TaxID=2843215 RepID=UPI001C3C46D8|nr:HAMP domain-containing sensor histidine kinase [Miltoncostaea marina]